MQALKLVTGLALAYVLLGAAGLALAVPPGYASPVFPAAGLALAGVIWFGRRALPGVWAGSFLLNLVNAQWGGQLNLATTMVALVIAAGAGMQAYAGRLLVLRWQGQAWQSLENEKDALGFLLLGGALAGTLSATVGVSALRAAGIIGSAEFFYNWWNWYVGDVLGILIFAPLSLSLLNRGDELWRERRRRVVGPMILILGVMVVAFLGAARWERQSLALRLKSDGEVIVDRISDRLVSHREVLSSLARFIELTPDFSFAQFEQLTRVTLKENPDIFALSFNDHVSRDQRPDFERRTSRLSPLGNYRITERDGEGRLQPATVRPGHVAVRYIVPLAGNEPAVGFDIYSEPIRRNAIQRAWETRRMAVTEPIQLVQEQKKRVGVLELLPVEVANQPAVSDEAYRLKGFVVSVVKVDEMVQIATKGLNLNGLAFQLRDGQAPRHRSLLYQYDPGNDPQSTFSQAAGWTFPLSMGDRAWELSLYAASSYRQKNRPWLAWAVGATGLLLAALLQVSMLGMTGRSAIIQRQNRALREKRADLLLAEKVFENSGEAIVVTDADGIIVSTNQAFTHVTGHAAADVRGRSLALMASVKQPAHFYQDMWKRLRTESRWEGEVWSRRKNGEEFPEWLTAVAVRDADGAVTHFVASFADITERKAAQAQIEFLAYHDPLTQLPNRRLGVDRVQLAIIQAQRQGTKAAVLLMDLDRFKQVNDSYGHSSGDALLKAVADRLAGCMRETDTLCRLSGDEFMAVLPDMPDGLAINAFCEKIQRHVAQEFPLEQRLLKTSFSIGVAVFPDDGLEAEVLLRNADTAMYEAKKSGGNACRFFDQQMNAVVVNYVEMCGDLRLALQRGEFDLHFQPQISLATRLVVGVEALIRWQHPRKGLLPPGAFMAIAEESGLIVEMGEWALLQACRQAQAWRAEGVDFGLMCVNLSALQFQRGDLESIVRRALEQTGLEPSCLELELTESVLIQDIAQVQAMLMRLRALGVRLAIDDFGTGYSSLAYLKRLNLDKLKIDRSFISDLVRDEEDRAIVRALIQMAASLNLKTVAEGVETEDICELLVAMGCDEVQGYLYSPPLPHQALAAFVRHRKAEVAALAPQAGHVLIVDDVEVNRSVARAFLERLGWTVHEADSGFAALQHLSSQLPEALLLDIGMPGMTGDELARHLRVMHPGSGLKIVAYTAHCMDNELARIRQAGFDEVLTKPVSLAALQAALPGPRGKSVVSQSTQAP